MNRNYILLLFIAFLTFLGVTVFFWFKQSNAIKFKTSTYFEQTIPLDLETLNIEPQSTQSTSAAQTTDEPEILLIATGDIIPARSVNAQSIKYNDPMWAFKFIAPVLNQGDIVLINLEAPLIKNCPTTLEGFIFCSRYETIEALVKSNVHVANVANNHYANYGLEGINESNKYLTENKILVSGMPEQPVYKQIKGIKFAFLGYNDIGVEQGIAGSDKNLIAEQINFAKQNADVVVVSMHWGIEYVAEPNQRQKELAYHAIDNGADLIIGNHPHWEQSEEYYKGKYIKYSHGNTIFDQMWSEETKKGVIGKYTFKGKNLEKIEFVKTYIVDYGQATIVE